MKKILVNFAHPAKRRSKFNMALRASIKDLEDVTINDLYTEYPDFHIDVEREQKLCEDHDIIVFQHPLYWYSYPAIVREWQDLVLQHGWAYGSKGIALEGKYILQAVTGGGDYSVYQKDGLTTFTIHEITSPFQATARLCKMSCLPPFTVLGIHRGLPEGQTKFYCDQYRKAIVALRDETMDLEKVAKEEFLNSSLDSVIREA